MAAVKIKLKYIWKHHETCAVLYNVKSYLQIVKWDETW